MMNTKTITRISLFTALICICGWISVGVPPFRYSLQTFGIALALLTLGGRQGFVCVGLYLLLGAVGLPVFAGFRSGFGALMDVTGGFLWGFLLGAGGFWLAEKCGRQLAVFLCLGIFYLCGMGWFGIFTGEKGIFAAFTICVAPYILPDILKIYLAACTARRLRRHM